MAQEEVMEESNRQVTLMPNKDEELHRLIVVQFLVHISFTDFVNVTLKTLYLS